MTRKSSAKAILDWVDTNGDVIDQANQTIWEFAEIAMEEQNSSQYLKGILAQNGFSVLPGAKGADTSFVAQWGTGKPVIGFLAEYDALPGLSQDCSPVRRPLREGAAGHACGHCTLGAAILGAVLALKDRMEREDLLGTIRFYGCPAEETVEGKVRMSAAHLFDDCDAALSWHPNDVSYVWGRKSVSMLSLHYNFYGTSAHAGLDPWNGRSALDAAELMNVGANYLREHIPPGWKIQYVTTNGGSAPNIVPDRAQDWYVLRAADHEQAEELHRRISAVAQGAAMMTETRVGEEFISGCYDYLPNMALADRVLEHMKAVGAPQWTEKDRAFARQLSEQINPTCRADALRSFSLTEHSERDGLVNGVYEGYYDQNGAMGASTDVGDVSWQIPVGCFSGASAVVGSPGHSWFYTAAAGSGIARRGARAAAKVLALVGYDLLTDTALLEKVKEEHRMAVANKPYRCPLQSL